MKIKCFLVLISVMFAFFISFSLVNALDLNLTLSREAYGPNQNFDGKLLVNYTGKISFDEVFDTRIENDDIHRDGFSLGEVLEKSGVSYDESEATYDLSGKSTSKTLNINNFDFFGFKIPINFDLDKVNFKLSSSTNVGPIEIDVGNDNIIEWQYSGSQLGWTSLFYPEGVTGNESLPSGRASLKGDHINEFCEDIAINFNDKLQESKVRIEAKAQKKVDGATLMASIEGESCPLSPGNTLGDVGCTVTLTNLDEGTYEVCLYSEGGASTTEYFDVPFQMIGGVAYYFFSVKSATYNDKLNGETTVGGENIIDAVEDFLDDCEEDEDGYCAVPMKIIVNSGSLTVSNVLIESSGGLKISDVYDLSYVPAKLDLDGGITLPLSAFVDLKTPNEVDKYTLKIEFMGDDVQVKFNVTGAPVADLRIYGNYFNSGEQIEFDASNSYSSSNYSIAKYNWDFGDGEVASTAIATHSYLNMGNYIVKLSVEDSKGIQSDVVARTLTIGPLSETLATMINTTRRLVTLSKSSFDSASSIKKEIYNLKGYGIKITEALTDLDQKQIEYDNIKASSSSDQAKETEYQVIANEIDNIRGEVPRDIVVNSFEVEGVYLDLGSLSSIDLFTQGMDSDEEENYNNEVYRFNQDNVRVNLKSRKAEVIFLDEGTESFILVKKEISVSGGQNNIVIEDLGTLDDVEVLTSGVTEHGNLLEFDISSGSLEIIYLVNDNIDLDDIVDETQTIVFTDIEVSTINFRCGDGVCSYNYELDIDEEDENNEYYCEQDCKVKIPWSFYIPLFLILAFGVFYINFYNGPGNFRELVNFISVKVFKKKRLFTTPRDIIALKTFVYRASKKGMSKEQIRKILLGRGWRNNQIDYVFQNMKK